MEVANDLGKGIGIDGKGTLYSLATDSTEFDLTKMKEYIILKEPDIKHRTDVGDEPEKSIWLKPSTKVRKSCVLSQEFFWQIWNWQKDGSDVQTT